MEKTRGRILSVQPDGASATVEVETVNFCARCSAGKGCGAGLFGNNRGPRQFKAPVLGPMELHAGDEVQIELAPQSVLHAASIVYGAPLAGMLVAGGIAYLLEMTDGLSALVLIGGIIGGATISHRRLRHRSCLRQFTPTITQRLARAE